MERMWYFLGHTGAAIQVSLGLSSVLAPRVVEIAME